MFTDDSCLNWIHEAVERVFANSAQASMQAPGLPCTDGQRLLPSAWQAGKCREVPRIRRYSWQLLGAWLRRRLAAVSRVVHKQASRM
jgi:hypothetical protein